MVLLYRCIGEYHLILGRSAVQSYRMGKNLLDPIFTDSFPEIDEIARGAWKTVLKVRFTTKVLHVRISDLGFAKGLVPEIVAPLEHQTAHHKADGHRGLATIRVVFLEILLKVNSVYFIG